MQKWVTDSVAPDQPVHPRSLTREFHCPLLSLRYLQNSGQGIPYNILRVCIGWSGASLSAQVRIPFFPLTRVIERPLDIV